MSKVLTFDDINKKRIFPFVLCSLNRTVEPCSKVGCTSEYQIKSILFCSSLGFHYLCTDFRAALGLVRRMGKPSGAVSINPKR